MLTGVFLSFLVYVGSLPPESGRGGAVAPADSPDQAQEQPQFDFYKLLPSQSLDQELPAVEGNVTPKNEGKPVYYLLQAGSFRQREDADRRRAELLLLGLEPHVQESESDNGHWFRVILGPFETHSQMAKARGLTAAQGIDTLPLKRER